METASSSVPPRLSGLGFDTQGNEKVQLLTNRMMLNNRIILVGEGYVSVSLLSIAFSSSIMIDYPQINETGFALLYFCCISG